MDNQEIGFDDWEKEAQLITDNQNIQQQQTLPLQEIHSKGGDCCEVSIDPYDKHLLQIERLKKLTPQQFNHEFGQEQSQNEVQPFNALLKCQKDFMQFAKNIGQRFKDIGKESIEKTIPENELVTFFQQFTLYLYGSVQWQSLEIVKQKLKIIKKDKKQEQNRVKKQREKEQRLKRAKQQTPSKQQQEQM